MSPRLQVSVLSLEEGHLCLSALKGYWSVFPSLFTYKLPEFRVGFVLWDLIRSFEVTLVGSPSWDLVKVLECLWCPVFVPLPSKPLSIVSIQTLFWLSLAKAKLVRELQTLSCRVAFRGPDLS